MQGQEDELADESDMDDYECGGYCKGMLSPFLNNYLTIWTDSNISHFKIGTLFGL